MLKHKEKNNISIPFYPKYKKCISCGVKLKTNRQTGKKSKNFGLFKAYEYWQEEQIIIDNVNHRLCLNCFELVKTEKIEIKKKSILASTSPAKEYETLTDLLSSIINNKENNIDTLHKQLSQVQDENITKSSSFETSLFNQLKESDKLFEACGLNLHQLQEIQELTQVSVENLFLFFLICHQGISQNFTAVLENCSQSTISKKFNKTLHMLKEKFVPQYLGAGFIPRKDLHKHIPVLFKAVHPRVVGIVDGTYFYTEKNGQFEFQKRSWSVQKGRNLIKELIVVAPNGKFLFAFGPFYGESSDPDIWNQMSKELKDYFRVNDEFLGDRGFIRVENNFKINTPVGLVKGNNQLKTQDANNSRKVTHFRHVIERQFGIIKKRWKILSNTIPIALWHSFHSILEVLLAVQNCFGKVLWMNKEKDSKTKKWIIQRNLNVNPLLAYLKIDKKNWKKVDTFTPPFIYKEEDLIQWNLGDYGLKLADKYITHSSNVKIFAHATNSSIVKVTGMTSRFSSLKNKKKYTVLVQFPQNKSKNNMFVYCNCKNGARTIGGCSHGIAVLKFLGGLTAVSKKRSIEHLKKIEKNVEKKKKNEKNQNSNKNKTNDSEEDV